MLADARMHHQTACVANQEPSSKDSTTMLLARCSCRSSSKQAPLKHQYHSLIRHWQPPETKQLELRKEKQQQRRVLSPEIHQ